MPIRIRFRAVQRVLPVVRVQAPPPQGQQALPPHGQQALPQSMDPHKKTCQTSRMLHSSLHLLLSSLAFAQPPTGSRTSPL